jgi:putative thiamine transport system ATP-binding protein
MADGLALDNVKVALNGTALLSISAAVPRGEVLTVMGPSGSGKSSLLSYIVGFLDPVFSASGGVLVDGVDLVSLPPEQRHAGILFQDPLLFPHMSAGGNLAFALAPRYVGKMVRRARCEEALENIGLGGFFDRDPATLSGGQKARVALARVLLSEPRMLLLDEPFSKLDHDLKAQMRELVFSKARARGLPVILVTHDPSDAEAAGGQLIKIGG